MRIYIADLGHNLLTFSSDTYPLGAANMATYLPAHLKADGPVEIRLFREPQDLKAAIDEAQPDILGLSNYTWNEQLALHFADYAKAKSSETLTVMGGPNWPLFESVQEEFLRHAANVDVYVDGPTYEGERAFVNLVQRFVDVGKQRDGVFEEMIPGNTWIDPRSQEFIKGAAVARIENLDDIPSPYLQGLMDPYFESGYFPLMQISRGCPFTCAFCNSGVSGNNKIHAHSIENVKADLDYIAARVTPEVTLCFADDNFGMYPRDEEIADYIGYLQDTTGWPKYIRTTTGKNKGERIIKVMRKIKGALPMTSAVQSMNPTVLENIKRKNIKLDTYAELQEELERMGMQSYGELIMSLPGETRESFLGAIEKFLDNGAKRVSAHQLMLLHGAELANPDSRERFGLKTKWRVVARNIGNYTGEPVVEVEEMVVDTPTFPFATYLDMRVFHLLLTIYYYEGNFEEAFQFAAQAGVKPFDLVTELHQSLAEAPTEFQKVIDDFLVESKEELFDSREEVIEWANQNYDGLVSGELGGNLLSKYSMLGRFYATRNALDFLRLSIEKALTRRDLEYSADALGDVIQYLNGVMLHVPFDKSISEPVAWTAMYDVQQWADDGYAESLDKYRLDGVREFNGFVNQEHKRLISSKVETFGEHPAGLGKITRTMFARDFRRDCEPLN